MATSKEQISGWFDRGVKEGATHLIIVCDTFEHEDYPCWVHPGQDFWAKYEEFNGQNMQRIMEVYDLSAAKEAQMNERRALRVPPRSESDAKVNG
jgi:hypothetical protein